MRLKLFSKTAQPDRYLALGIAGDCICYAQARRVPNGKPALMLCGIYRVPEVNAEALDKFAREKHLSKHQCTTLLNHQEYQLSLVEAPNVPPQELKTAIRWRIKDLLDYPVDEATVDVLDIPADRNARAKTHSMYAVSARNDTIQKRVALFDQARIKLSVIDIPELAQRNMAQLVEESGRGLAMLSFNPSGGIITFTHEGELYLARHIDITLSQIYDADASQRQYYFDRVTLELQRSLDHFDRQFHYISLSKLLLAPLPGPSELQQHLAANLYVPVAALALSEILDLSAVPQLTAEEHAKCFFVIGAALRREERVL